MHLLCVCQKYRDNELAPRLIPHFDNHALADRPMFMDDNARPHRAQIVQHFLQQEAVQTIPWPAMSPDMNPMSNLQSKENQPQTVTPPPPKAVVPKMWLSWNEVFGWRQTLARPSVGRNKKRLSSDQWTRRQRPFSTAGALRGNLVFGGHISTRTVIRRLHHQGMRTFP
jgi:hypothetical protein